MIDCIILAGGLATRIVHLLPEDCPKFLAPIQRRPFAEYLIPRLVSENITNFVISAGHLSSAIQKWVNEYEEIHSNLKLTVVQDPLPNGGTDMALRYAVGLVRTPVVLVCNGDTLVDIDLQEMIKAQAKTPLTVCRSYVEGVGDAGFSLYPRNLLIESSLTLPHQWFEAQSYIDIGTPAVYERVRDNGFA